jgi:hypothetical protein
VEDFFWLRFVIWPVFSSRLVKADLKRTGGQHQGDKGF